jgi:hypothetical protein
MMVMMISIVRSMTTISMIVPSLPTSTISLRRCGFDLAHFPSHFQSTYTVITAPHPQQRFCNFLQNLQKGKISEQIMQRG